MRVVRLWGVLSLLSSSAALAAEEGATYTLGVQEEPGLVCYAEAGHAIPSNAWMNGTFVPSGEFSTTLAVTDKNTGDTTSSLLYSLANAEAWYSWERSKPEYYLSDRVASPDNVDWAKTQEEYEKLESSGLLFNPDPVNPGVYAIDGGFHKFTWYLRDGTSVEKTYTIGVSCSGRPRRIYWTDAPYNGPTVSLKGKFVKLYGNASLLETKTGVTTNLVGGIYVTQTNVIVKGVYIDPSAQVLHAVGGVQGQFVLAYYDTGDYKNILHMEVVEACRPEAIVNYGTIGTALKPDGRGYSVEGLEANVTAGISDSDDNRGDYLYMHAGPNSYSPKHGNVYPLRPTVGKRWKAEVYWMETDPLGVKWPFEMDHYEIDWPTDDGILYVRGDIDGQPGANIYIPSEYTASLEKFQEPEGHARAVTGGNVFTTTGAGWSLVRLEADDDIWFLPIHSVLRSDPDYFTLESSRVLVGEKLRVRSGVRAGLATGLAQRLDVTDTVSGYLYKPASGTQYNPDFYFDVTNATGSASTTTTAVTPSALFAVNVQEKPLEVWWSRRVQLENMPYWIDVPTLPQAYKPVWPTDVEAPTIVLASQQGSANESAWHQHGGAHFDVKSASMRLASGRYFADKKGFVGFWTRPVLYADGVEAGGVTNPPSALLDVGSTLGKSFRVRIGKTEQVEFVWTNRVIFAMPPVGVSGLVNSWMHVGVTLQPDGKIGFYRNGVKMGETTDAALVEGLSGMLDRNYLGISQYATEVEETNAGSGEGQGGGQCQDLDFVECGTWAEVQTALVAGQNARLTNDVTTAGVTSMAEQYNQICLSGVQVAIDLNGHTVKNNYSGTHRIFCIQNGAKLTLRGSGSFDGCSLQTAWGGAFACVETGSSLVLEDEVVVKGFKTSASGGAVYVLSGGTFTMNGGTIQGSSATYGGGVALYSGLMNFNGGTIESCRGSLGGGVFSQAGQLTTTGGRIVNNSASERGGGVYLHQAADCFTMNGGEITGNSGVFPCICAAGGTLDVNAGVVDIEPTRANFSIGASYVVPAYYGYEGVWRIGTQAASGRQVADVAFCREPLIEGKSLAEIEKIIMTLTENTDGVVAYYSFRPDEDLVAESFSGSTDERHFKERCSGMSCTARNVSLTMPGSPRIGSFVIVPDESTTPSVYYENDSAADGYNPNEEHAFVKSGGSGYVVWALRGDLNTDGASIPGVLASYLEGGEARMQFLHVAVTNADWPTLAGDCTVGLALPGPHPLTAMDDPWLAEDYWTRDPSQSDVPGVAYRDRKGQLWARAAGTLPTYMYYRLQDGFWFPQYAANKQPAAGTAVPWLSVFANPSSDPISGAPACWTWTAHWPTNVETMCIGQTLTTASGGLPGVWDMKSCAVVYPTVHEESGTEKTVVLTDPTTMKSVDFDCNLLKDLGLTTDPNGGLMLKKGKYYFTELPPHLSKRVYVDTSNNKLCFIGELNAKNAGVSILYVNVLSATERQTLKNLVPKALRTGAAYNTWTAKVDALAPNRTEPNTTTLAGDEVKTTYLPRDHYALAAMGSTNWVVLVENDGPVGKFEATIDGVKTTTSMNISAGDAVNMKVFKVIDKYYEGRIVTREDENNLLSQRLSILYTESFAGEADNYEFEWRSAEPAKDGTVSTNYVGDYVRRVGFADALTPRITIGEQGDTIANMINKYWICRYRAKDSSCPAWAVMGDRWSGWCAPPALAEGWVQRVLNNVTPFNQLMNDLYENKADTVVSMIQKAGAPYQGDIAFNNETLNDHGLIEIYETLLNKAESMSLLLGEGGDGVCKQLLLCAERLHDLYTLLGDEAYSDAKNPTIGFGSTMTFSGATQTQVDFGAASSGLFCFDNQVSSLLDEELCLLRGRTGESMPYVVKDGRKTLSLAPYYNRLLWNFTKGITAGEVAYAVNYNIEGTETVSLSEEQAARLYPQGHGDAYGHYLSALKGWYRLLRNPYFNWARAQGEMNVADAAVNVDYYEEAKFAEDAAKVAKTAADVVDLTARKAWGDTGASLAGYRDETNERSFGYGEWANRGAYGALVNWMVANSLLPSDAGAITDNAALDQIFKDAALTRIDRGTVSELAEICRQAAAIQSAEDRADYGHNPLGLDENAIPFDITPIGVNDGTKTHYEQIRERAGTAMANARALLDRAQEYSNRLRMIQESTDAYRDAISEEEEAYDNELIGYYGTPYSDDIGTGKTYEQGYSGPDLLHYTWMDLSLYGLTSVEDTISVSNYYFTAYDRGVVSKLAASALFVDLISSFITGLDDADRFGNVTSDAQAAYRENMLLKCQVTASGLMKKPDYITGRRTRQGSIQDKYGEFLRAYVAYLRAQDDYNDAVSKYEYEASMASLMNAAWFGVFGIKMGVAIYLTVSDYKNAGIQMAINTLEVANEFSEDAQETVSEAIPSTMGAGVAVITDPRAIANAALSAPNTTRAAQFAVAKLQLENALVTSSKIGVIASHLAEEVDAALSYFNSVKETVEGVAEKAEKVTTTQRAMHDAILAMNTAVEAYRAEIAKAEAVCEKRYQARMKQVSKLSQARYNEMLFRQLRNQALARYTASFDLAQKYVWETAKAYDYETTLLSSDKASGDAFLKDIVKSRSLGSFGSGGEPLVGDVGDLGLAGILAQMDANWLVLKSRLGINNPQPYATWFSLRSECFRILPSADGDGAWAKELKKYWVDDIRSNPDFIRYCQPLQSQFGLQEKEPGLIIPFATTIDFAYNLFGKEMAGGDHAYDATWYSTRIYAAGVWFDGYNAKTADAEKSASRQLADTPVVYLVPMGLDCMRVPGLDEGTVLGFNVVDQVIAAPYAIGSQHLNDLSWYPSASDGDLGGADETTKIRLHPSFRAYFDPSGGEPTDDKLDCTRLVGRSVWNTKWMLVIPAGQMNYDCEKALSIFINGYDTNRDGKLDLKPVSDIKIGFKTYSNSGN